MNSLSSQWPVTPASFTMAGVKNKPWKAEPAGAVAAALYHRYLGLIGGNLGRQRVTNRHQKAS